MQYRNWWYFEQGMILPFAGIGLERNGKVAAQWRSLFYPESILSQTWFEFSTPNITLSWLCCIIFGSTKYLKKRESFTDALDNSASLFNIIFCLWAFDLPSFVGLNAKSLWRGKEKPRPHHLHQHHLRCYHYMIIIMVGINRNKKITLKRKRKKAGDPHKLLTLRIV